MNTIQEELVAPAARYKADETEQQDSIEWSPRPFSAWLEVTEDIEPSEYDALNEYYTEVLLRRADRPIKTEDFDTIVDSFDEGLTHNEYYAKQGLTGAPRKARLKPADARQYDRIRNQVVHMARYLTALLGISAGPHSDEASLTPTSTEAILRGVWSRSDGRGIPASHEHPHPTRGRPMHRYPLGSVKPLCGGGSFPIDEYVDMTEEIADREILGIKVLDPVSIAEDALAADTIEKLSAATGHAVTVETYEHDSRPVRCAFCMSVMHHQAPKNAGRRGGHFREPLTVLKRVMENDTSSFKVYRPSEQLFRLRTFLSEVTKAHVTGMRVTRMLVRGNTLHLFVDTGVSLANDTRDAARTVLRHSRGGGKDVEWIEIITPNMTCSADGSDVDQLYSDWIANADWRTALMLG